MSFDALGTMEKVFLGLWVLFSVLYWLNYRKTENLVLAAVKVALLFGFVYGTMKFFDWVEHPVPSEQVITLGLVDPPPVGELGPRIPVLTWAFEVFVTVLIAMVIWYGRRKVTTIGSLVLSTWDRGHWYMLPVIFILLTIGLLLVAAAASPVLSPFIYTLF